MYQMYNLSELLKPDEVLVYLRKSRTDDPTLDVSEVLARHESILNEWAKNNLGGNINESNKYREIVSGETIDGRPQMLDLLKRIESPKIKAVLVVEVQRLGRPDLEDIGRLSKLFRYSNTLIITPQKTFDLRNEYDREAFERELMRGNEYLEYTKKIMSRGRLLSVQQGNYLGSVPPYGFDKITVMDGKTKCPTLKENPEQADVVRLIFDMYANQNMGRTAICIKLDEIGIKPPQGKLWSSTAVKEMLKNVHYIGKVRWNWRKTVSVVENGEVKKKRPQTDIKEYMEFEGRHDGIISEELFFKVQDKLGRNHRATTRVNVRNPFATLLYCKKCGRTMILQISKKCAPRLTCLHQSRCGIGSCAFDEVLERVCDVLAQCIEDFEIRLKNNESDSIKLHARLIENLKKKFEELEEKELAQWEMQSHPDVSQRMPAEIFDKLNRKLLKDKEEVQQALCKAYESMPEPVDYQEKIYKFREALEALKNPDVDAEVKNELLKACIDRIEYYRERPQRKQPAKGNGKFPMVETQWTNPPIELDVKLRV